MKPYKVNWEEQWALFAENFYDGVAHIELGEKTLLLTPGPGFGDLSHPTTFLMLEIMKKYAPHQSIIDIGCGSGILSLAALLLNAKEAIGIDIDNDALKHARKNAKLNHLKARFRKTLPTEIPTHNIFLMNMILPEQRAFNPQRLNHKNDIWITSGILESQRELYLAEAKSWGWQALEERRKSEWMGFVFSVKQETQRG